MGPGTTPGGCGGALLPALGELMQLVRKRLPQHDTTVDEAMIHVLLAAGKDHENALKHQAALQRVSQLEQRVLELEVRSACTL